MDFGPPDESDVVRRLASDLEGCVASIPAYETDSFPGHYNGYIQHPKSTSGKYIRCLAQHSGAKSIAVLFYGYTGPNGVFSAAWGLQARALAGEKVTPLITSERHPHRCHEGQRFLQQTHVARYVDLRCKWACKGKDESACMAEVREEFCPSGPLDLLIEDITPAGNLALKSVLAQCTPRLLFAENSGIRDTHAWIRAGNRSISGEWWAHYSEDEIHLPAEKRQGEWRIVVNKRRSDFPADVAAAQLGTLAKVWRLLRWGWLPEPPRRFSVYIRAAAL